MTSEVLILNKRAAVIAADSAITTTRAGGQPRYSKSATKIFDITEGGYVAAAFFGNAQIEMVPWELAMKQFRRHLGKKTYGTTAEYADALGDFLSGNPTLFPPHVIAPWVQDQFDQAALFVVQIARGKDEDIVKTSIPLPDRQAKWKAAASEIRKNSTDRGVWKSLSTDELDACLKDPAWTERAKTQLATVADIDGKVADLAAVDAAELAELAHRLRYSFIDALLSSSGIVVVGYGDSELFPSYCELEVVGHVGSKLAYRERGKYQVTHTNHAMIQPLAQTSMIDMFTDGFGSSLEGIIGQQNRKALRGVVDDLLAAGVPVPMAAADQILDTRHKAFMTDWKRENWAKNFTPLISVIATLDVDEMAHLAETLLVLESLKERVTSPSEEVGGPIDVAVITKNEGLVWIKRKHYFDTQLNLRYAARLQRGYLK